MPFQVSGEQAKERMRAYLAFVAMADGPHADVAPLEGPEPALHIGQPLAGADRILGRGPLCGLAGAEHVRSVEARLGFDPRVVPRMEQTPPAHLLPEVPGHPVPSDDPTLFPPDPRRIKRRAGAPGGLARAMRSSAASVAASSSPRSRARSEVAGPTGEVAGQFPALAGAFLSQ